MPWQLPPAVTPLVFARRSCCILLFLLLIALPNSSSADLFYRVEKVIKLTDLNPAANGSIPFSVTGLNNAGRMTGYFPSSNANKLHAFVWDNAGHQYLDLNDQLAADSSMATCINEAGTVAGVFWELGTYAQKGFLFYADGTVSTFTGPDAGHGAIKSVTAINPTNSLIGTYMASDGTTRGFIVQHPSTGSTIADLGDPGDPGDPGASTRYFSYLWPNAVNAYDQVVGNVYLIPRTVNQRGYTKGFFWDTGMTAIDASDLSANWTATGLNGSGQVFGLYDMSPMNGVRFSVAGSYRWDGSVATDVGDLGGGNGASLFALRNSGLAFGTSLNTDGELHLFRTDNEGDGLADMGSVSVYNGDGSFLPFSVAEVTTVLPPGVFQLPGANIDFAGFGIDVSGNTRSLLWKDGGIHSVIDLMPAYLSFAAISHAYGSMVLINNSEQIACAGKDTAGQQMALLLSIDPDTDNDGLPDSWEMQYYGHLGVVKGDLEIGGGGLTNWQAFQQGSDPHDFYNGQQALVTAISGSNQVENEGTILSQPLLVRVTKTNGTAASNVPVTFALAQGDGSFSGSATGTFSSAITVSTNSNGQASVYFKLPGTTTALSRISATSGSAQSAEFKERTKDSSGNSPSASAPSDVNIVLNADGSTDTTWTNNTTSTDPIPIYMKNPSGEWVLIKTVPAGSTSVHITEAEMPW